MRIASEILTQYQPMERVLYMTKLIIVRHGNTFAPYETPLRVGARTDIPLVDSGKQQAKKVGEWLKQNHLIPDKIYTSELQRTFQTAELIVNELNTDIPIIKDPKFNEIDYGPDEGKSDAEVINRIGEAAIKMWDENAIVPHGWQVDPKIIIQNWLVFGKFIEEKHKDQIILVVTSNGIARFAPYLTGQFEPFKAQHSIKISTGALCILEIINNNWQVERWNFRPT